MGITITQKSRKLTNYSSRLTPSRAFKTAGNKTAQIIFNALKKSGLVDIDRVKIAGSMGKKTSWMEENGACQSDYDLVVFCNWDIKTQGGPSVFFHKVPRMIAKYLNNVSGVIKVELKNICIQFEYNGFHFDLVPAINFAKDADEQKIATYQKLRAIYTSVQRPDSRFSAGLCETGLQFFKSLNQFVRNVVRLCKIWYNYAHPTSFYGSKLLIETVAVYCGLEILDWVKEKKNDCGVHQRMYYAFRDFLRRIKDFKSLSICITSANTYKDQDIPDGIRKQKPLVLDPANPYNNLAYAVGKNCQIMQQYRNCALYTLSKLGAIGKVLPDGKNITWRSIFAKKYEYEMFPAPEPECDSDSSSDSSYYDSDSDLYCFHN